MGLSHPWLGNEFGGGASNENHGVPQSGMTSKLRYAELVLPWAGTAHSVTWEGSARRVQGSRERGQEQACGLVGGLCTPSARVLREGSGLGRNAVLCQLLCYRIRKEDCVVNSRAITLGRKVV